MKQPDLSIVIPVFNEEKRVSATIDTVMEYFTSRGWVGEIIVVDDKSLDKTREKVREKMIFYHEAVTLLEMPKNYYKGWPVRCGMLKARGKYIMTTDCDLSTPITEADKLINEIKNGADLAIGSRIDEFGYDMRVSQPLYRRVLGKIFTFIRSALISDIKDSQCGFKMFDGMVVKRLFEKQRLGNIIYDVEILYLAKKLKLKIAQVPVVWNYGGQTKMRLTIKNAFDTLVSLFKIWWWHRNKGN